MAEEFHGAQQKIIVDLALFGDTLNQLSEAVRDLQINQKTLSRSDRHLSQTSLEAQKQIAELWQHMSRQAGAEAGGVAGKKSAETTGKKWGALYTLIALITTLVNSLITGGCQLSPDEAAAEAPAIHH